MTFRRLAGRASVEVTCPARSSTRPGGIQIRIFVKLSLSSRAPVLLIRAVYMSVRDAASQTDLEGRSGLVRAKPSPVKTMASVFTEAMRPKFRFPSSCLMYFWTILNPPEQAHQDQAHIVYPSGGALRTAKGCEFVMRTLLTVSGCTWRSAGPSRTIERVAVSALPSAHIRLLNIDLTNEFLWHLSQVDSFIPLLRAVEGGGRSGLGAQLDISSVRLSGTGGCMGTFLFFICCREYGIS